MDRDNRDERTQKAMNALMLGVGPRAASALDAIRASYEAGITDEFVEPTVIEGTPRIEPGDTVVFFNFRPDRARQLSRALLAAGVDLTTMTRYASDIASHVMFGEQTVAETLAEVLAEAGIRQLHVAETEKYAHVTYFFNGGVESEWPGETRILVPSPRDVPELRPQARDVGRGGRRPLLRRGRRRVRLRRRQLREPGHGRPHRSDPGRRQGGRDDRPLPRARGREGDEPRRRLPVTADHGNAEQQLEADGVSPHTAHSTNRVPLVYTGAGKLRDGGELADIAPTVLSLLGVRNSIVMTGKDLLKPLSQ